MTNCDQQSRNSADAPADQQHEEHRAIADTWLRRAIAGIRQMYVDEDVRREVARGIFERPGTGARTTTKETNRTAAPTRSPTP